MTKFLLHVKQLSLSSLILKLKTKRIIWIIATWKAVRLLEQVLKQQEPVTMFLSQKIKTCFTTKRMPNSRISSLWWYFQTEKILSEPVHSQNDLWSLIRACQMKPSKLESMHQQAETSYKLTSRKLRILHLKSFLILNKFLLFGEFLKRL